uniref:Paxillin-like isoform X4 n=1 Tax=Pseudodiaptomus poplesia TaxID=213370 RepID=A0A0U2IGC0_9MAXI|nr:paxillin-like isoform X4 [Pseudodiaptomus poplesia]
MGDTMICAVCNEDITDKAMKAKDLFYHEKHFTCVDCKADLRAIPVYSKDGVLYCEDDYRKRYVPKCAKCDQHVTSDCVRAMDRTWHPEHFQCYGCLTQFTQNMSYREKDGKPYCEHCYTDTVLPKCGGCANPITDRALKAFDKQWHIKCFVCVECKTTFEGAKNFYSLEGNPVCGPCAGVKEED